MKQRIGIGAFAGMLMASVAFAQQSLPGSWEFADEDEDGSNLTRLTLVEDGSARLTFRGRVSGEFLADEDGESPFAEEFIIDFVGTGTWSVQGDTLLLNLTERVTRINGDPFVEAIDKIGETLALSLAEDLQVPEEDRPALITTVQTSLRAQLDEEVLLADLVGFLGQGIPFELEADSLRLGDGEETENWTRVQETVAPSMNWAHIKRQLEN